MHTVAKRFPESFYWTNSRCFHAYLVLFGFWWTHPCKSSFLPSRATNLMPNLGTLTPSTFTPATILDPIPNETHNPLVAQLHFQLPISCALLNKSSMIMHLSVTQDKRLHCRLWHLRERQRKSTDVTEISNSQREKSSCSFQDFPSVVLKVIPWWHLLPACHFNCFLSTWP